MQLSSFLKIFLPLPAVILFAVSSCVKPDETAIDRDPTVSIPLGTVGTKASSQFVTVDADGSWTISLDFGEAETWASIEPAAGKGRRSDIVLSWEKNEGEDERSCTLTVTAGEKTASATFIQNGTSGPAEDPSEIKSDIPGKWLELPATDDPGLYFITHDMERAGKKVRNYSYYYSVEDKLAVWVAYPLNKWLIGSGSRTDDWGYDPKVPSKYQPVLFNGFRGGYDRGHQLPSADRYGSGINETTFYFTNMTPQKGELNQQAWAGLETMVREWCYEMDTLYVVTGADIRGAQDVAYDNNGQSVTVPEGYFKALLGYKKGGSIGNATGGYIGIAFYFDHRRYDNDKNAIMDQSMTIDELEDKIGCDLFVNLPDKIGEGPAARVESEVDSWWN